MLGVHYSLAANGSIVVDDLLGATIDMLSFEVASSEQIIVEASEKLASSSSRAQSMEARKLGVPRYGGGTGGGSIHGGMDMLLIVQPTAQAAARCPFLSLVVQREKVTLVRDNYKPQLTHPE
ncbi:hypothetical protein G7054_g15028 [Neopestalotiopsis clavispora]|nr:hypothetical protein G7054_g15028 [Neopestalotiopsis clavispora]